MSGNNGISVSDKVVQAVKNNPWQKIGLGLLPFTPVKFTGNDALIAWLRLAGYGTLAYLTYNKARTLSYIFMGATGVCALTSFTGTIWDTAEKSIGKAANRPFTE